MRILPDTPSLDFLRQEAKDLLAGMRESHAPASLAQAQRALAGQYGFRSWLDLKAEVERRRVALPSAEPGLGEALASSFDLGALVAPISAVSHVPMGRTWSLTTDRGRWLASPVYSWINNEQAERGNRLREAARVAGITSPAPARSAAGRLIETVAGGQWRVHGWMDLGPIPVQPLHSDVASRVGEVLGILHALRIPSAASIDPYLTWRRPMSDWAELLERATAAGKDWVVSGLIGLLPTVAELQSVEAEVSAGSVILCNCNLVPEHVRTGRWGALVIVEWAFTGSNTPEQELGYVLGHWMMLPTEQATAARDFLDGYRARAREIPELAVRSFATHIASWLNWTYHTACAAISDSQDDPEGVEVAERQLRDLMAHPLSIAKLEGFLGLLSSPASPAMA
ncbi:MAG: hypothetical protein WBH47_10815 [Streptosporangiaceae bacterium]